jgi:Fur family ferric uptake transcriptional regulator
MKRIHRQEKEQFKKLFQKEHIDRFEDRYQILEVFLTTEHHVTVVEMTQLLKTHEYRFDTEFVEMTLNLMSKFGFAKANRFDNGLVRYEHRHLGQHHDHMICTRCQKIIEFEDDALEMLQAKISETHGFHMLQHKMELYGICSSCLKDRDRLIPLSLVKKGERLIIKEFTGGSNANMRLLSMGLRLGDEIDVVTNRHHGQLVVAIDLKRYIIGRGLAEKIWVQPLEQN